MSLPVFDGSESFSSPTSTVSPSFSGSHAARDGSCADSLGSPTSLPVLDGSESFSLPTSTVSASLLGSQPSLMDPASLPSPLCGSRPLSPGSCRLPSSLPVTGVSSACDLTVLCSGSGSLSTSCGSSTFFVGSRVTPCSVSGSVDSDHTVPYSTDGNAGSLSDPVSYSSLEVDNGAGVGCSLSIPHCSPIFPSGNLHQSIPK